MQICWNAKLDELKNAYSYENYASQKQKPRLKPFNLKTTYNYVFY